MNIWSHAERTIRRSRITAANEEEAGGISQGDYHYEPEYLPEGYAVNEVSEEYDFFYHIEYVDPQAYAAYEQALAKQAEQYGGEGEIPQGERVMYEGPFISMRNSAASRERLSLILRTRSTKNWKSTAVRLI